jgi:uncharacterized protein
MSTAPGSRIVALVRANPIVVFFVMAFALTWTIEIPWVADQNGVLPFHVPIPLQVLMGWMPGVAAILVTAATGGRAGVRALLRQMLAWRVRFHWYVLAILGVVPIVLAAQVLDPLLGGTGLHLSDFSLVLLIGLIAQFVVRVLISGEELAWRGFALPHMQAHQNALRASLVLGAIWSVWHLPLFFVAGNQRDAGFPVFLAGTMAMSIVYTRLFNGTRGSVLLCMLLHASTNVWTPTFEAMVPASDAVLYQQLLNALWVVVGAVVALTWMRPAGVLRRATGAVAGLF